MRGSDVDGHIRAGVRYRRGSFPGSPLSDAFEYSDGWVFNTQASGWMEGQPKDEFGVSIIVHKADGEWKYCDVGNPEFLDIPGMMKRIALPDKYAAMIRPKHNAG